jgi:ankyrin repeat protein
MEKATGSYTPLIIASWGGHLEVVRYLLEQGANRDKANNYGWTSLHCAALRGHLDTAKLLMVYGADLNARDNQGQLPIDMGNRNNEEIRQAICEEPRRRIDDAPGKRCIDQDPHPNAAASASAHQEDDDDEEQQSNNNKLPAEEGGEVAEEDQDSEPSSDEEDN